jgi:Zn-dependent peptidase ImmA (M78 family)/transcriptional regulator with XRE-family HTH domain
MIGARIRLARKKAGFSLRDLAKEIGNKVSAQAIGKYERDEMEPSSGVLISLSKALRVSLDYLLDSQNIELANVDFRTKANTSAKDRARVETEALEWVDRYLQVENILDIDGSRWSSPIRHPKKISTIEEAEELANEVRKEWKLGCDSIPNMTELLEEKGLKVLIVELPQRVSGFTCIVRRANNLPEIPVIVVNKIFSLERRRLTLAHELAHRIIDHSNLSEKEEEKAANRFAAAFLIPKEHLENEVGKHRKALGYKELVDLKYIYKVSAAALLVRLKDIGVISESVLTYAFQSFASSWRTSEPDPLELESNRGEKERPRRLERLCYRALAEDLISLVKAAELLRCSVSQAREGLRGPDVANNN